MKEFSLEEYLAHPERKVVTRDGIDVRIICTDFDNPDFPVVGEIKGHKWPSSFTTNGLLIKGAEHIDDLFFAPEKHEGWANIYGEFLRGEIFSTKEEAEEYVMLSGAKGFVATAKVEWEE